MVVVASVVREIVVPSSTFMLEAEVVVSVFSVSTGTMLMVGDFRFFLFAYIFEHTSSGTYPLLTMMIFSFLLA